MQDEANRYAVYRTDEGVWMRSHPVHQEAAAYTVTSAAMIAAGLDVNDWQLRSKIMSGIWPVIDAMLDNVKLKADLLSNAIDAGGWDMSPCGYCGQAVVCLPDGLPACESCAMRDCS